MKPLAFAIGLLTLSPVLRADGLPNGTWVRREVVGGIHITMTVETAGMGKKLTYYLNLPDGQKSVSTVVTQLDGKDVPQLVDGKPSGQTMAVREIDSRHLTGVVKFQGKEMGTSKAEVSLDGKLVTVENSVIGADGKVTKTVEHWDKK